MKKDYPQIMQMKRGFTTKAQRARRGTKKKRPNAERQRGQSGRETPKKGPGIMEEWIEIVPPLPMKEALARFETWKKQRVASGQPVDENSIRQDIIRGRDGHTYLRYTIRANSS